MPVSPQRTKRRKLGFADRLENGEDSGEDEGGAVRAISIPAEGDAGALEGSSGEDRPQGVGKLAQRHPFASTYRRSLLLRSVVPGEGEARTSLLDRGPPYPFFLLSDVTCVLISQIFGFFFSGIECRF